MKTKLTEVEVSLKTLLIVVLTISSIIGASFGAMNYYFTPRHIMQKEIGCVKTDISEVKVDVKWIRTVWEEGIQKSKEKSGGK